MTEQCNTCQNHPTGCECPEPPHRRHNGIVYSYHPGHEWKCRIEKDYYIKTDLDCDALLMDREVSFFPGNDYLYLQQLDATLDINKGYAWDGPRGPTIDTKTNMRASLVHDALYQLMREGLLPQHYRKAADKELYRIMIEDGACKWRAWYYYMGVRWRGAKYAKVTTC